ncbi:MAG: hypothetical protein LC790_00195, partial [Actinobacteria bacterium]|nr:hypothetical protein [Actinomycetota bacterium]
VRDWHENLAERLDNWEDNRIALTYRPSTATDVVAVCIGLALIGYVSLKLTPDWFASQFTCRLRDNNFQNCLDAATAQANNRQGVTTATLAIFAGALGAMGAIYTARTFALNRDTAARNHELDRAGQITERFTRAIDQLGSDKLAVRLGGIYALERIARDSKDDHPQVVEVLTAYVRERAPRKPGDSELGVEDMSAKPVLATDVQATMSVLGRRNDSHDRFEARLDLAGTDLRGLVLERRETRLDDANRPVGNNGTKSYAVTGGVAGARLRTRVLWARCERA